MTMHSSVRIARRRWTTILLTTLILVLAAGVVHLVLPTSYAATTKIYVPGAIAENFEELPQGEAGVAARIETYADLATTPAVLDPVIEELGLGISAAQLAEDLDVEVPRGTSLLEITATADHAQPAADLANATVTSLRALVNQIEAPGDVPGSDAETRVELAVVQEAEPPARPQSPRAEIILGIGLGAGILLGIALAFLREAGDSSVRTPEDLRVLTAAPLLGVTRQSSAASSRRQRRNSASLDPARPFQEIRRRLMFGKPPGSPSSYVVTSSVEGEGRTTVAVNLARSLVAGDRRTLLIGADFTNPDIVSWFRTQTPAGLREVLAGRAYLEDVVITDAEPGLDVLPAGREVGHGLETSDLDAMAALLEGCAETYDVTIIDAPPLLEESDAALLAQITTGVIMVARYGEVTRAQLGTGLDLLTRARARLVGVVFTGVPPTGPDSLQEQGPPRPRRGRRGPGPGSAPESGDAERQPGTRPSGPSSPRRRRLPDGTLTLREGAPRTAHIFSLRQDEP